MKFSLVVLALVLATCSAQSNNAFWGNLGVNDTNVYNDHVDRSSRWLQVISETIVYPPKGVVNNHIITAIRAFDQKTNGNGAKATIIDGGISNTTVTVVLESQRGHGIDFQLQIYTTPCRV